MLNFISNPNFTFLEFESYTRCHSQCEFLIMRLTGVFTFLFFFFLFFSFLQPQFCRSLNCLTSLKDFLHYLLPKTILSNDRFLYIHWPPLNLITDIDIILVQSIQIEKSQITLFYLVYLLIVIMGLLLSVSQRPKAITLSYFFQWMWVGFCVYNKNGYNKLGYNKLGYNKVVFNKLLLTTNIFLTVFGFCYPIRFFSCYNEPQL